MERMSNERAARIATLVGDDGTSALGDCTAAIVQAWEDNEWLLQDAWYICASSDESVAGWIRGDLDEQMVITLAQQPAANGAAA